VGNAATAPSTAEFFVNNSGENCAEKTGESIALSPAVAFR